MENYRYAVEHIYTTAMWRVRGGAFILVDYYCWYYSLLKASMMLVLGVDLDQGFLHQHCTM